MSAAPSPAATEILTLDITRELAVPRELVFRAWRDNDLMKRWSAPRGFTMTHSEADFREGGAWRACMRSPAGEDLWLGGVYREIVPGERLVFTHEWDEDPGTPQTETLVEVTLADDANGKTRMHFHQERFRSPESRDGHRGGWEECFDILEEVLAEEQTSTREIVSTRLIDAPRELVFRAYTEPEHLARWWGPKGFTNTFEIFELRPGGTWRFQMHAPSGTTYPNESVFREIVPPERIELEHLSGHYFRLRIDFADEAWKTRVTFRMIFETREERDRIATIAVPSNEENFDRLEAELARMRTSQR